MTTIADLNIRPAREPDVAEVTKLIADEGLVTDGIREHIGTFVVAFDGDRMVGCSGSEAYQYAALIRSVAVLPEYRRMGLGRRLVRELLDRLASRGLREFYLLTIDAEAWFKKR
ncbi:MAG: GNAT family N-acetyltransferase, partial [Rubricoccaceae bacterium]|nr:GNAT family N-acetyltransferase [Rubricoccaceae bacterium]